MSDKNNTDRILNSLDGLQRAEVPDHFYARLRGRMERELLRESRPALLLRPAFLAISLVVILVCNIVVLKQSASPVVHSNNAPATINNFATEYNLDNEMVYE